MAARTIAERTQSQYIKALDCQVLEHEQAKLKRRGHAASDLVTPQPPQREQHFLSEEE